MQKLKSTQSAKAEKWKLVSVWCEEMATDWGEWYVPIFRKQLKKVLHLRVLPDSFVVSASDCLKAFRQVLKELSKPKALAARGKAWDASMKVRCGPCKNFKKFNF